MDAVDWRPVFVLRNNATGTCRGSSFKPGIHYARFLNPFMFTVHLPHYTRQISLIKITQSRETLGHSLEYSTMEGTKIHALMTIRQQIKV